MKRKTERKAKLGIGFQIYSLGCKVNQYDSAVLRRALEARGFIISQRPELVVINTCSVTKVAIRKDRYLLNKLRRDFPQSLIVIMGCWPETAEMPAAGSRLIFWGVGKVEGLLEKISSFFPRLEKTEAGSAMESGLVASSERSRYFLKVGDGCNQFCSYCLIPFARGRLWSRPRRELVLEAEAAAAAGYREIVLCGIHLGRYGEDNRGKEMDLIGLLKKILEIKDLGRVRLSSIEINEVTPALIELMKEEPRICRHLHISLQSGSDQVLRAMGRPYTTAYFQKRVTELRRAMPDIAISTDIIVGFQGESETDFQATGNFAEKIRFSKIHVFSFSAHEKTKAYSLPGKVKPEEIAKRSKRLRTLSGRLEREYQEMIIAKYRFRPGGLSLVAEKGGGKKIRVKTEFGFDLRLSESELSKNTLV